MGFSSMSYSTTQSSSLNLNTNGNLYVQSNDYEGFEKEGKYKSVDELDLSVDDSKYDYASLTEEDIASLVGKMSQQEYDEFINGMVDYYGYEKDYLNKMLDEIQPIITDLDDRLLFTKDAYLQEMANYRDAIQSAWFGNPNLENSGTTYDEFMAMTYDEKLEFADGKSEELLKAVERERNYVHSFNESVQLEYGEELGVSTMEELIKVQEELHAYAQEIQTSIDMINYNMDSAKYDYIYFLKSFDDFSYKTSFTEEELATFQTEINGTYSRQATGAYSYNDYVQLHPEVSQLEFVRMVKQVDPNAMIADVDNSVELNNLVRASEVVPQLGKTYAYLYSISADDAAQYLKDVEYEINQINGQLDAKAFLDTLYEKDGDYDNLEIVANELGVTTEGLLDGLGTFFSGVGYSFEALLTAVGLTEENRTLSSEEYKKMYILQALMPQDAKEKMGLIKYNNYDEKGFKTSLGAENADPNSVIDYTKEYSGFLLDANYEISQGIGNMAPSIILSAYNPILGSVAMGDSAGGNAYHNAMVEGHSYVASLAYGVFTGTSEALTERLFGGLPGLSDVEVTGVGSYLKAAGREGFQESFQEIMDVSYRVNVMGEDMPSDEELLKQITKSGVYGAITAGILQSPSLVKSVAANHVNTQSVDANTNVSDVTGTNNDTQVSNPLEQTEINNTTTTETNQNTVTDVVDDATVVAAVPTSTNTDTNVVTDVVEDVQVSDNTSITENVADNSFDESVVEDVVTNTTTDTEVIRDNVIPKEYSSEDISEAFNNYRNEGMTTSEFLQYIDEGLKSGDITKQDVALMFTEVFGTNVSSWAIDNDARVALFKGFLEAADGANLTQEDIAKCALAMEGMEDYYLKAGNLELQTGVKIFETYRTHGMIHVFEVLTQSMNTINAMNEKGITVLDMDTVMLAAMMHDTGMSGGYQLVIDVGENDMLEVKVIDIQADGGTYRESHSFNSGFDILAEYDKLSDLGYSDEEIAVAAVLAFAHSKSNSGLGDLSGSEAGWSFAIQALDTALAKYNSNPPDGKPINLNFIQALVDAGVLKSSDIVGVSDGKITVKSPTEYVVEDGKIKQEPREYKKENGTTEIKMENVETGNGGKKSGKINFYEFNDLAIEKLSYEALAVRIGDALTNNDNAKLNQYWGEITFKTTKYENQHTAAQVLEDLKNPQWNEKKGKYDDPVLAKDVSTNVMAEQLTEKGNLDKAAAFEAGDLTFEVNGNEYKKSQQFVLGENNQTYRVEATENGVNIIVTVKDSEHVPFCTLFAIEERFGELNTKGNNIFSEDSDHLQLNLTIEIDKASDLTGTADLYKQYAVAKEEFDINVKIVYKDN